LESKIIKVKDLLNTVNLNIPEYQRPYKWDSHNINQLIDDILFFHDKETYRFGTVVLYKDKNNNDKLDIVDGQQRTISLLLIYFALKYEKKQIPFIENLPNWIFSNQISQYNVQNNFQTIKRRINEFDKKTINFLFEKCEVVVITLSDLTEAFQFFDSQNARGKDLEPHDLLKAFHLREMNDVDEKEKSNIIHAWEDIEANKLSDLFSNYLFRIRNWSKGRSARYFTKKEIDVFKGLNLSIKEQYNYAKLYAIANYYVDDHNVQYHRQIDKHKMDYPFGLDQSIINGKRFFEMVGYYQEKLKDLDSLNNNEIIKLINFEYPSRWRTGDKYVRSLFNCALMFYIDKFGEIEIDKAIEKLFIWAYTLRLRQHSVQIASLDNYAIETKLFNTIREATNHKEIINMYLEFVEEVKATNIDELINKFGELKYANKPTK
jgi:hypothetical protein